MTDKNSQYPPVAFYFSVYINGIRRDAGDNSFQEVSGLNVELETEDVAEGGENRFVHNLPKQIKHPKLVLKRGIAEKKSPWWLGAWRYWSRISPPLFLQKISVYTCSAETAGKMLCVVGLWIMPSQ